MGHIGFSYHSSAKTLDRILTEHPEVDFVQLAVNYIDWDSEIVQARECYEVARRHDKKVVVMEPVKGGLLANLPTKAELLFKIEAPRHSVVSWAFRFLASLDGIITNLSGMSSLEQMQDNIRTMENIQPLGQKEKLLLDEAIRFIRDSGPILSDTIEKYRGLTYHGIPATTILQTYSICQIQPNPNFTNDINYPKNAMAESVHMDLTRDEPFSEETVILSDGIDGTLLLKKAEGWLREYYFREKR